MGIIYLGIGIGGMLVPQIARGLTASFGWRDALMILGLLMIAVAFPMAWFVKENPEHQTAQPSAEQPRPELGKILKTEGINFCDISVVFVNNENIFFNDYFFLLLFQKHCYFINNK